MKQVFITLDKGLIYMRLLPRYPLFRVLLILCITAKASADNHPLPPVDAPILSDAEFSECKIRFETQARQKGISEDVITQAINSLSISQRVLELDRKQPEFTSSFATYLNQRVTDERVAQGRALLQKHRTLLERVSKDYGIAPSYLVSFWGMETNFGSYLGKMSILDSLATLGCDKRRSDFFTTELMNAFTLLDEGVVSVDGFKGSWAGAMGNMQFMPSAYLKHAVDYNGDGKRDLWNSLEDAMGSAGNFLKNLGWEKGERWGREVILGKNFDYLSAGLNNRKSLSEWANLGVKQANGNPLPRADMEAAILIPSGHNGPAFLVYRNFDVIMRWNRSESYAIAVGYFANRIAGMGKLLQSPVEAPRLNRQQVIQLQEVLKAGGFIDDDPDGILGPNTRRGISRYQAKKGMIADGFPSEPVLKSLGINFENK